MFDKKAIGDVLRQLREEKSISLEIVQKQTGVKISHLSQVELGKKRLSDEKLASLWKYYGMKKNDFVQLVMKAEQKLDAKKNIVSLEIDQHKLFNLLASLNGDEDMKADKKKTLKEEFMQWLPEWLQDKYIQGYLQEEIQTFEEKIDIIGENSVPSI